MPPQANGELFMNGEKNPSFNLPIRDFDPSSAEGELRLRLEEVKRSLRKLDEAQIVSQELLESVVSI